jgi:hypothetical protein
MSDQKSLRNIFLGALITFIFGVLMFFLQQHYQTRKSEDERGEKVHNERAAALRDFSKACSDLAGAAGDMEREAKYYLSNVEKVPGEPFLATMEHFKKQLVILQGIGGAAAPLFNLEYEECAPPPKAEGTPLEESVNRAIVRARCEVNLCNEQRDKMSSYLRRK